MLYDLRGADMSRQLWFGQTRSTSTREKRHGAHIILAVRTAFIIIVMSIVAGSGTFAHATSIHATSATVSPPCVFSSAPDATPAFCETFDQPGGIGNRSGDLNGTLWGVSRQLGATNFGQNQFYDASPTTMQGCGPDVQVQPPNDVAICDGRLVDAQSDQGGVTSLAMYAKQPFDIAGRTGTIEFDVSDDSHGNHRAWPELWYTDQPVPAPFDHLSSLQSVPRNGFGIRFAGACPAGQLDCRVNCPAEPINDPVVTVDSAVVVNNYVSNDSFMDVGTGAISVKQVGCVKASSGPGDMNHFELRVSHNEIDVYGTDAGSTGPLTELAVISNMSLSLTRGLVWLEDVHYNGNKDGPDQGTHTFTWDNVAFDGPVLPRDLAFDVLDRLTPVGPGYPGILNLGWLVAPTDLTLLTLPVPGVYNISQATGALLTFNYSSYNPVTLSYQVNSGSWHDIPWPFGACYTQNNFVLCGSKTLAVPVALSDLQPGTNTVAFKSTDSTAIANVDLVLQGAGGFGCAPNCPAPTTTTLTSSINPSVVGTAVTLTATVTGGVGVPTGSITFSDSGTAVSTVPVNGSGAATLTTSALAVGTHVLTASYSGASGFSSSQSSTLSQVVKVAPPTTQFNWESGTLAGWKTTWGQPLVISNSTNFAYSGKHSLRIDIAPADTHSAIDDETSSQLSGFRPGTTVTLHIYNQAMSGVSVHAFSYNEEWIPNFGATVPLQTGWNTVTYLIPQTFTSVHGIGMQVNNPGSLRGTLYLDAVTTS